MATPKKEFLLDARIAVLIADGFEEKEMNEPVQALRAEGAAVDLLTVTQDQLLRGVQSMNGLRMARSHAAQALIQDVDPSGYQAVLIPGGALSVDQLRNSRHAIAFLQNFSSAGKLIGSIGHGAWLLADSGAAQGMTITSAPTIRHDLERANAVWKDDSLITDRNLITIQGPIALARFTEAFLERLEKLYAPQASGLRRTSTAA